MKNVLLLFPTQLFQNINYIKEHDIQIVILYEEPKFFTKFRYHKLKLLYHRITCKEYYDYLASKGIACKYINFNEKLSSASTYPTHMIDPIDHELEAKYTKLYKLKIIPSPQFTLSRQDIHANAKVFYKNGKFSHVNFYKWQRQRLEILINKNGKPKGNRWSFDTENRKKIPKNVSIPTTPSAPGSNKLMQAKTYIERHFPQNYGEMNLIYPINFRQARSWLSNFIQKKLKDFGQYQDASLAGEPFLFHSVLTPMLNIGLLTDIEVVDEIVAYYDKHKQIPIASVEGFIRQIIGWRSYVYSIYCLAPEIQKLNFFKNNKKLTDKWWVGIGVEPIDDIIQNKIVKYAYTHHIERLMYLGSFMLMSQIHPKEVYRYFMEWTIDAYEWVMVPNIYGMSQFADGGKMMKRPYISSSNYILKMSNYKRGSWCDKWDELYHSFLKKHSKFFKKNYFYANSLKSAL